MRIFWDTNYRRSIARLDEDYKGVSHILTSGGLQSMVIISEPGLYGLLFNMRPQKGHCINEKYRERIAKVENFTDWVFEVVLPSIRKNGGYILGQETMTDSDLLEKALIAAHKILEGKTHVGGYEIPWETT